MSQSNVTAAPEAVPSAWQRFKNSDFLYYFKRDKVAMASFTVFMVFFGTGDCRPCTGTDRPL